MRNPFIYDFSELFLLISCNCIDSLGEYLGQISISIICENALKIAVLQYKNSVAIFKQCRLYTQSKNIKMLESNVALFGQLHIS